MKTKDEQDLHLQTMIEANDVETHRPRKVSAVLKDRSFKYHILLREKTMNVCRDAFFLLYSVSDKRISWIRKLLREGKTPHNKCGMNISGNAISAEKQVRFTNTSHLFQRKNHISLQKW